MRPLALLLGLFLPAAASAAPARRIIVFSPQTSAADRLSIAGAQGTVVRTLDFINAVVIETPAVSAASMAARLKSKASVLRVDSDPQINWLKGEAPSSLQALPLPALQSFPRMAAPPSPEIPWGVARVDAPAAWAKTRGEGVKVCVIDTGVDTTHPDLAGNVKGGWNAIAKSADYKDDNGHGTHVTGTIAALGKDGGVIGVAPAADVYAVKVLDSNGNGSYDDVIAGMQWAVENHMQVASLSLGADKGNDSLAAAVAAMAKAGVVLVAAAGNSGGAVSYPAAYPGVVAVAAMDSNNQVASFSSRGPQVSVIAPGVAIKSTYMGGGYQTMDGTSMATPHVSGLAALAIAAKRLSAPDAVLSALKAAAVPLPGVPAEQQGAGVVDAAKLVQ